MKKRSAYSASSSPHTVSPPTRCRAYERIVDAQHAYISDHIDRACDATGAPFINNCNNYDQAQEILGHIYGTDGNLPNPPADTLSGTLLEFDQNAFVTAAH